MLHHIYNILQHFKIHDIVHKHGKATFGFASDRQIGGVKYNLGLSREKRKYFLNIVLQRIHHYAPWTRICDPSDVHQKNPITMLRDSLDCTRAYMSALLDSDCVFGHSDYHHSCIITNFISKANLNIHRKFGIPVNAKYYVFPKLLSVCVTGDGGRMTRVPLVTGTIPFAFVRVLGLNDTLQHSRHSGICCLASQLSVHDVKIQEYMSIVIANIGKKGKFCLYSNKKKCWCIFKYECYMNGDWEWLYQMVNRCSSPSGTYRFPGLIRYKDGQPKMVHMEEIAKYHALVSNVVIDDCKSNEYYMNHKWTGYTLNTDEISKYLVDQVENELDIYKDDHPDLTPKEERDARRNIAHMFEHGLLYASDFNNNDGVFDVCHCWWTILVKIVTTLLSCTWSCWKWDREDVIYIFTLLGVEWISHQVVEFIDDINYNRDDNVSILFRTNGLINKTMICGLPDALCAAANIAAKNGNDTEIGLCCVMIRVSSLMRKAFGILLKDTFELKADGSLPDCVYDMIDCVNLQHIYVIICLIHWYEMCEICNMNVYIYQICIHTHNLHILVCIYSCYICLYMCI